MKTFTKWTSLIGLTLALSAFGCKKKQASTGGGQTTGSAMGSAGSAEGSAGSAMGSAGSAEGSAGSAMGSAGSAMGSAGSGSAAMNGSAGSAAEAGPAKAEATIKATKGHKVSGTVTFTEEDGKTVVAVDLHGLKPGKHGFHVHETGDCSAPDAKSAGGHFNPDKAKHGAPTAKMHHTGDLGNLVADKKGNAKTTMTVDFLTVKEGPHSIVGKAVIVHGKADDLKSQPAGAAGPRVGCGVIEAAKE